MGSPESPLPWGEQINIGRIERRIEKRLSSVRIEKDGRAPHRDVGLEVGETAQWVAKTGEDAIEALVPGEPDSQIRIGPVESKSQRVEGASAPDQALCLIDVENQSIDQVEVAVDGETDEEGIVSKPVRGGAVNLPIDATAATAHQGKDRVELPMLERGRAIGNSPTEVHQTKRGRWPGIGLSRHRLRKQVRERQERQSPTAAFLQQRPDPIVMADARHQESGGDRASADERAADKLMDVGMRIVVGDEQRAPVGKHLQVEFVSIFIGQPLRWACSIGRDAEDVELLVRGRIRRVDNSIRPPRQLALGIVIVGELGDGETRRSARGEHINVSRPLLVQADEGDPLPVRRERGGEGGDQPHRAQRERLSAAEGEVHFPRLEPSALPDIRRADAPIEFVHLHVGSRDLRGPVGEALPEDAVAPVRFSDEDE